ncbi:hypothetical protein DF3PA_80103 [Candidatus Defluviicoccus seviourii]|uniref:Uncharacterized protein n=1 Tax=Candidatus Defluviicoccus seviourii TaxID=2565273 RepID=A0A564WJW6_9PROT|nr:hypothetical protein DF3PA_80103 [Candidatus Defluviicoccus seviourii]
MARLPQLRSGDLPRDRARLCPPLPLAGRRRRGGSRSDRLGAGARRPFRPRRLAIHPGPGRPPRVRDERGKRSSRLTQALQRVVVNRSEFSVGCQLGYGKSLIIAADSSHRQATPEPRPLSNFIATADSEQRHSRTVAERSPPLLSVVVVARSEGGEAIEAWQTRSAHGLLPASLRSGTTSSAPVTRASRMVGDGNHEDLIGELPHDDVVGEPLEHKPLRASGTGLTRHGCERDDCLFKKGDRSIDRSSKFDAQTGMSAFVPSRRCECLLSRLFEDADAPHLRGAELGLHPPPKLIPVDQLGSAGVDLVEAAEKLLVPSLSDSYVGGGIEARDEGMRKCRTPCLRQRQRFRTQSAQIRLGHRSSGHHCLKTRY